VHQVSALHHPQGHAAIHQVSDVGQGLAARQQALADPTGLQFGLM
jgi:hypothetical protein